MKSSSKLELAVDKNVFYTAAEIGNPPTELSIKAMRVLLKILDECHRIVLNEEYLKDIVDKIKKIRKVNAHFMIRLLNELRSQQGKLRYVEPYENLEGVPKKDIDVASFALYSRDKILIVMNIDAGLADEELVKVLKEGYGVNVLSADEFLRSS